MARVDPTTEQLQAAHAVLRKSDWAGTLAEDLLHPIRGRLVRLFAARVALGEQIAEVTVHRPPVIAPDPPPPRHPAWRPRPSTTRPADPAVLDRKRAASGERDDD